MNAAEEMVIGAARQAAERGDVTALEASLLIVVDNQQAAIQRVRELHNPIPGFNGSLWCGAHCEATADGDPTEYPCETIRALDGGAE